MPMNPRLLRPRATSGFDPRTVPWAGDYVLAAAGGAALLVYFTASNRWRVI